MENDKKLRGFARMSKEKRTELAAKGGRSVKPENRSFSQNKELASEAGRKGGRLVPASKRSFTIDRKLAAQSGQVGGLRAQRNRERRIKDEQVARSNLV